MSVCLCVRPCVRPLPVTGPMCEAGGWEAVGCAVGTRSKRAGRVVVPPPSPPHHPGGRQGSFEEEEEEDGGGRRGAAPSIRRAGCAGACPVKGVGSLQGGFPHLRGLPGSSSTHRWVPGRCWSIQAPAQLGRLPPKRLPVQRGARAPGGKPQQWGALPWLAGARGGWMR